MRLCALVLAALILNLSVSHAQELCPAGDKPLSEVDAYLAQLGATKEKADPALAAAALEIYNNNPPPSNIEADYTLIFSLGTAPTVLVVFVSDPGCVRGAFEVPRRFFTMLRERTRATN